MTQSDLPSPISFDQLSDYEQSIVRLLKEHDRSMSVEEISAKTGIAIDIAVTACVWLAQIGWVKMDRQPDPADLELYLADDAKSSVRSVRTG